jgi:TolA-binding protein
MRPTEAGDLVRDRVAPPWHDVRAAAVQRRVLEALRKPVPARSTKWAWLVAALALAACATFFALRFMSHAEIRLELSDGSVALLDPAARVVAEVVTPERIELRQTAGAASYDVTHDPARTFVVQVDPARVEVLGTAFRIERLAQSIHVSVSRGRVKVVHGERVVLLGAGEEITLSTTLPPAIAAAPEPSASAVPAAPPSAVPSASATPVTPSAPSSEPAQPSAAELFRRADDARAAGDQAGAIRHLRELIALHPKDGRAMMATFTIGRIEAQRGDHAAAAAAFEACGSGFAGEALAEAALARSAAGQTAKARALAQRYLELFPNGPRAKALAALAQ